MCLTGSCHEADGLVLPFSEAGLENVPVCRHSVIYGKVYMKHFFVYCTKHCFTVKAFLFHGADILSFEDDGHICGYLTSWIALPTKYKKLKKKYLRFLTDEA